jgi:hypothetical protein
MGIDEFFKEILEFLVRFDRAQAENKARALKEKKAREKKERAALKKATMAERRTKKPDNLVDDVFGKMKQRDAKDVLDSIEESDRSGDWRGLLPGCSSLTSLSFFLSGASMMRGGLPMGRNLPWKADISGCARASRTWLLMMKQLWRRRFVGWRSLLPMSLVLGRTRVKRTRIRRACSAGWAGGEEAARKGTLP